MADDLKLWLGQESQEAVRPPSDTERSVKIVPRGLRSFDARDAGFFLELLPGPRDREGLPDSICFWKNRIEETDPDSTFSVGLIYGPSGCGKSSLVKAGLLPHLSSQVIAVYVEATANDTEARLLRGLHKACSDLPSDLGLSDAIAALRREKAIPGKKVLIVLDQFEQWLHAHKEEGGTELVQALRQCDGSKVQCIVMVRDDFWLAVSRFMQALENPLLEAQNSALVDLFDLDHARKVLAAYGKAFGQLPEKVGETSQDQKQFLEQAVQGLAQEGKVICVRLAIFAEMVKGRPWTPGQLKEVGGMEGVGVTFLEETFSASTAPPEHRCHQKAARAVLQALLPESGTDIKGAMRSRAELLAASGYSSHSRDFDDLLRILDAGLRLITPTDVEGKEEDSGQKYYQLTHDYLVPSLRDWLTRKQKETRSGRSGLLLADCATIWNARPENRQLPSLLQWCNIRWLTRKRDWTLPQREMMRKAAWFHGTRGLVLVACMVVLGLVGWHAFGRLKAQGLLDRLLDANTTDVLTIVQDMSPYRRWIDPLLREANQKAKANQDSRKQLHVSLALLPVDAAQADYLYHRLLDATPQEVPVLVRALSPHRDELVDKLWAVLEQPNQETRRLPAASALASYEPDSQRWAKVQGQVANDLVAVPALHLAMWMESLRPVSGQLQHPLAGIFRDVKRRETERSLATDILADYAANQPQVLADLLMDADERQFLVLYPKVKSQAKQVLYLFWGEVDKAIQPVMPEEEKERLARLQVNAAVALLRLDYAEKVWPLLQHRPDPRVRSHLIHRMGPLGVDAKVIIKHLDEEPNVTIRRALLLGLGEYDPQKLPLMEKEALFSKVVRLYQYEADAGLHGAAEWLLRQWKLQDTIGEVDKEWMQQKEQRIVLVRQALAKDQTTPQWYVNGQGQTMVVIPGPVEYLMGSPSTEAGRSDDERQHRQRIGRTFALATKSVTIEQFLRFGKGKDYLARYAPTLDCPVNTPTWYMAVEYCNWLSEQEGLPRQEWCYEGVKLAKDYLKRTGYRLPTEAEWEYACRAGAVTARSYGEADDLLGNYGWFLENAKDRSWPVGSRKPNDWGLFDMHGNIWNWCQNPFKAYDSPGKCHNMRNTHVPPHAKQIHSTTFASLKGVRVPLLCSG